MNEMDMKLVEMTPIHLKRSHAILGHESRFHSKTSLEHHICLVYIEQVRIKRHKVSRNDTHI